MHHKDKESWNHLNDAEPATAIKSVLEQVWVLFHRLGVQLPGLYNFTGLSQGRRGVLRILHRQGPKTVPQIARLMLVARQNIQGVVDYLSQKGLSELVENPDHKRSKLVCLTEKGETMAEEMNSVDEMLFGTLTIEKTSREILQAAAVLKSIRESLEGEEWKILVKEITETRNGGAVKKQNIKHLKRN